MMKKCLLAGIVLALCATTYAESIRTALTKENRLPRLYEAEGGVEFMYYDSENGDRTSASPYLRYTALQDLALYVSIPYHRLNPDLGSKEEGFGDVALGLEFVPFKDLFGYPWIMPHGEISFSTGSEEKGLGSGSTDYTVGVAIGTTVSRKFHFVADARYQILDQEDNIPSLAGSIVWDLDRNFSLIAEIELARQKEQADGGDEDDSHPITFLGGMSYQATRNLAISVHGGTTKNSDVDSLFRGRVSYRF